MRKKYKGIKLGKKVDEVSMRALDRLMAEDFFNSLKKPVTIQDIVQEIFDKTEIKRA